jgi:hypothetical protein
MEFAVFLVPRHFRGSRQRSTDIAVWMSGAMILDCSGPVTSD